MAKVLVNESSLTGIADAIRGKNGSTDTYKPSEMAAAITAISGGAEPVIEALSVTSNGTYTASNGVDGYSPITVNVPQDGSPPESAFLISGDCNYRFANNGWNWFIEQHGDKITTEDISNASHMFYYSSIKDIPFEINVRNDAYIDYMFYETKIKTLPYINGKIQNASYFCNTCSMLNNIPEDWAEHIDWSSFHSYLYATRNAMFASCFSIKYIPDSLMAELWGDIGNFANHVTHNNQFYRCFSLDEVNNIIPHQATLTTNRCNDMLSYCGRLKNATFALQDDGTPYTVSWKAQILDLSISLGYLNNTSLKIYILNYNSGITADKEVTDATTYAALKDDPDWFTTKLEYSRYNHDSAVATINSLPDTSAYLASAGGTNTIKFKGAAGSATDGGAINTLTEEEIAVATARGWTVTLV